VTTSQGFDTTRPGAPERLWQQWTGQLSEWTPPPGDLLVVSPHPDDETLGAGGLIHLCQRQGGNVTVLSLTDGEAACPEVPDLARVRQAELIGAMGALGIGAERVLRLGLPDGCIASHELQIERALHDIGKDFALFVGPFEQDGHPDHDSAGRAVRKVAAALGRPLARYPIWAWHRGSQALLSAHSAVRLSFDEVTGKAKERAIDQFQSQLRERDGGAIVPHHVLNYFRRDYEVFLL
jgi:LmbE family N-acetylglucosaminyl deacetylase